MADRADDRHDVWLDGAHAGTLHRARGGDVTFAYAASYQALRAAPSLSVSMPRHVTEHAPEVTMPWIDNLLPDNDAVRARWAAQFDERRPTAFNLLRHMGADCAGAVQVVPAGEQPQDGAGSTPLAEAEIAAHLRELRADDSSWAFEQHGGRFSLGGQQGKFALARGADGSWHQPTGRGASTHIFKIGVDGVAHSAAAELVTMRAARALGLSVASVESAWFEDQAAVVVERFDRLAADGSRARRLHQEDMCQALGLWRSAKYESDGGPGVRDVAQLVARAVDRRDLARSRDDLARAVVLNWVAAGTDAHAKNLALLHVGARTVLAPLYDLVSASLLWPADEVRYKARLAMKLGGEYRLRALGARHLERAAADLGVDAVWLADVAVSYATAWPDTVRDAAAGEHDLLPGDVAGQFVDRAAARGADVVRALRVRAGGGEASARPGGATWVPAHERAGRSVVGHWRTHPGR
ncbi:type II toxin-antitoxin system HipA family toxin [Krasilnikoviella flava]|uniref:Serine/threonine-protein kinase HipA n=1 Tax=Krasilnikoviella flava TaxID=526729 RepID=A0A1T5L5H6_9MICO|nr:type II toxin-antitoxin system HipA family toxin [Krasilnikoviella flava]SKC71221.1 serine/threonine-protein kinase HipA [Krasilnikoviella flava]